MQARIGCASDDSHAIQHTSLYKFKLLTFIQHTSLYIYISSTECSQKLRNNNNNNNNNNDGNDNNNNAIRHALTTMVMPFWYHHRCCSMLNVKLPRLIRTYHTNSQPKAGILVIL